MSHGEGQEDAMNSFLARTGPGTFQISTPSHLGYFIPIFQSGKYRQRQAGATTSAF